MKRKPIKIDWDELEDVFTNPQEEVLCFLDRVTGRIHLDGEGEDDDLDDAAAGYDQPLNAVDPPRQDDPTRVYVQPPDATHKVVLMKSFVSENPGKNKQEEAVVARLTEALGAENPGAALSDVLNADPELRDTWYRYRSERLHRIIEEWLDSNGVEIVDSPPWKK